MLLPLLLLLALFLLLPSGCAVREDSSYPAYAPVPAPSDVRVAVKSANHVQHNNVVAAARANIGTPYRFGGSSPDTGFDCSGLVCWSYSQMGVRVPRRAQDQLYAGSKILGRSELQPGDIVVFRGTNHRTGWHSGIYTGNGMFVHSPRSGKNVTESSLDEEYFARHFAGGSRVIADSGGLMAAAYTPASRILGQSSPARSPEREEARFTTAAGPAPKSAAGAGSPASKSKKDEKGTPGAVEKKKTDKAVSASQKDARQNKKADPAKNAKPGDSKTAKAPSQAKKADTGKNRELASPKSKTAQTARTAGSDKGKNAASAKAAGSEKGKNASPAKAASADKKTAAQKTAPAVAAKDPKQTVSKAGKKDSANKTAPSGQKNAASAKAKGAPDKASAAKADKPKAADKKQADNAGAKRAQKSGADKSQKKKS